MTQTTTAMGGGKNDSEASDDRRRRSFNSCLMRSGNPVHSGKHKVSDDYDGWSQEGLRGQRRLRPRRIAVTRRIAANTRSATITTGGAKKGSEASDDCALGA